MAWARVLQGLRWAGKGHGLGHGGRHDFFAGTYIDNQLLVYEGVYFTNGHQIYTERFRT